jgi:hypothetical protein
MKAYREWIYSSIIFYLGLTLKWVVSFTTLSLYPQGKSPLSPLHRRLGGPQTRSGRCELEKSALVRNGTSTAESLAHRYTD